MRKHILMFCLLKCLFISVYSQTTQSYVLQLHDYTASYNFYYHKIATVVNDVHRYASVYQIHVQGDANYYDQQGHYELRIDKFQLTVGRFDGFEVRSISGNPEVATFYVFDNAIWIKSNYKWGGAIFMSVTNFNDNPVPSDITSPSISQPTGALITVSNFGMKYDFDNHLAYKLPYTDVNGNGYFPKNVGIGTSAPSNKLSVLNSIDNLQNENSYPAAFADLSDPTKKIVLGYYTAIDAGVIQSVHSGNSKKNTIINPAGGNVGIGQYSPSAKFSVFGEKANLYIDDQSNGYNYYDAYERHTFRDMNGNTRLLINSITGNVGIGTTNIADVNYKLFVETGIRTRKLKVDVTTWPDYVFHRSYNLRSLENVEAYIKKYKHLPDVPSEEEVLKEGQDVGEVQAVLLKKIEELTLYVIDLQKQITELKQKK